MDHGGGEVDHCGEALVSLLAAHGDALEVLELAEEVLDQVAPLVDFLVDAAGDGATGMLGDHCLGTAFVEFGDDRVAVEGHVGDQRVELDTRDEWRHADGVEAVAGQEDEPNQISKRIAGKRYWRVPVMDGEFLTEETTGMVKAIGGGNFLVLAESQPQALVACEAAIEAMRKIPNVIMPFPGGVVRSGSKVGSKYKTLNASTNDAFCPTLKGQTKSELSPEIESVMEIVIDGLTEADIKKAMRVGIQAVCDLGSANGIRRISAGNYGGKLGPFLFHLREIMA